MSRDTKRILSLLLAVVLLSGLFGCGSPQSPRSRAPEQAYQEAITSLQDSLEVARAVERIATRYDVSTRLARPAVEAAYKHRLDPDLFGRLIQRESSWRPRVSSPVAHGLAQVRLSTARIYNPWIERRHLYEPEINTDVAAWYLRRLVTRYGGDVYRALRAYNAGPTRIQTDHRVAIRYADDVYTE